MRLREVSVGHKFVHLKCICVLTHIDYKNSHYTYLNLRDLKVGCLYGSAVVDEFEGDLSKFISVKLYE